MTFRELFPALRMPVLEERDGGCGSVFGGFIDEESTVRGHVVLLELPGICAAAPDPGLKALIAPDAVVCSLPLVECGN